MTETPQQPLTATLNTQGPAAVRAGLIAFYHARLPDAVLAHRALWALEARDLPQVKRWNPYEDEVVGDETPSVALSVGRSSRYVRDRLSDPTTTAYWVRYECRLFCWLKAAAGRPLASGGEQQPNPSQRLRDRYATVLTSVLLNGPSLGAPGVFRAQEDTLTVDYSAASHLKGDRYLSGVSLTFSLEHRETLALPGIGSVQTVDVGASVLNGYPQQQVTPLENP